MELLAVLVVHRPLHVRRPVFFFWVLWVDCVVYRQSSDELDSTHIPTHPSIYITKHVRVGVGAAVLAQHGARDAHAARGDGRLHVACCVGR